MILMEESLMMANLSFEMRFKSIRSEMISNNWIFQDVISSSKEFHLNLSKDQLLKQIPSDQK